MNSPSINNTNTNKIRMNHEAEPDRCRNFSSQPFSSQLFSILLWPCFVSSVGHAHVCPVNVSPGAWYAACIKKFFTTVTFVSFESRLVSNISGTKSQHLKDFRTVLRQSLPNPLKPYIKSGMKMKLEQRQHAMLQLHLSDRQFYCIRRCVLY